MYINQAAGPETTSHHAQTAALPIDEIVREIGTVIVTPDPSFSEAGSRP